MIKSEEQGNLQWSFPHLSNTSLDVESVYSDV